MNHHVDAASPKMTFEKRESRSRERRQPGRHLLGPSTGRPSSRKSIVQMVCVQVKPFPFVGFVLCSCDCDIVAFVEVSFFPVRTIMRFLLLFSRQASQAVKQWWVGRDIANANVPRYVRFTGGDWRASAQNGQFAGLSWPPRK